MMKVRRGRWSRWWARPVVEGSVHCSLRGGDVELSECERCIWLLDVDLEGEDPRVRCRPDAAYSALRAGGI